MSGYIHPPLTEREKEVGRYVAHGKTDKYIAEALVISCRTVRAHIDSMCDKLMVVGKPALAVALVINNIVEIDNFELCCVDVS